MSISPYRMVQRRFCHVEVLGKIWMPMVEATYRYELSDYDLQNIGDFSRDNVDRWLGTHAGDFSSITDFHAVCGDADIPWTSEENEMRYGDLTFGPAEV